MKLLDMALKDMLRSSRSATSWLFMFGLPILVTALFYFMFGRIANQGDFQISRIKVAIANLDRGGPRLHLSAGSTPGDITARTMSELVVAVLTDKELASLIDPILVADAQLARQAVDSRQAQVAIIIPDDFSRDFADPYAKARIDFYQDPTLTLGPQVIESILNQFMDSLSGVKNAIRVTLDLAPDTSYAILGQVIDQYLADFSDRSGDLADRLLLVQPTSQAAQDVNPMIGIIGPIMAGMMVLYAFYTGLSTSQSILREEEEHTLPRLFTTPTPQSTILGGKLVAVFITVFVQVNVLLLFGRYVFSIHWGNFSSVAWIMAGTVLSASAFGVFANSFLKNSKQSGALFGGVLTFAGMLGMVRTFGGNSPSAALLGNTVSLLVPQGWAVRGYIDAINNQPITAALGSFLALLAWSTLFFAVGVWRFSRRYS
jgi:ABC-2 type transport system permease protein